MQDFASYTKKKLRDAQILTDDQFALIDHYKGFFSLELHKGNRYAVLCLERPLENPRNQYLLIDFESMTVEPVEGMRRAKQMIRACFPREEKLEMRPAKTNSKAAGQRQKKKIAIQNPSPDEVEKYLERWDCTPENFVPESVLNALFTQERPYNCKIEDIILKAAVLNTVYNTQIYSVYPIARRILSLHIDERLQAGDETLVPEIMSVDYADRHINHYSFATKYCSFHHPEAFPIFDSYVEKVLLYYQATQKFCDFPFSAEELKNYSTFKKVIAAFQNYFGLEKYTVKQLDQYLWQLGKEYF